VPWHDSLAVSRTLALWQAAVGDALEQQDLPHQQDAPQQEES
jgi:hypothetical protein